MKERTISQDAFDEKNDLSMRGKRKRLPGTKRTDREKRQT